MGGLAVALLLVVPARAGAEWHFKPFLGFTFEPSTTWSATSSMRPGCPLGPDVESQSSNVAFGMGVALLGDVFGVEGEWRQSPGFFQARDQELVASSSAQTFTGSVVVAMPRRIAQYSLRPYLVGGAGVMRLQSINGRPPVSGLFSIDGRCRHRTSAAGPRGSSTSEWGSPGTFGTSNRSRENTADPAVTIDGLAADFLFGAQTWRSYVKILTACEA